MWRSGEAAVALAALLFSLGNLGVKLACVSLPTMEISALIAAGGIVLVLATVLYSGQPLLAKDYKVARLAATRACLVSGAPSRLGVWLANVMCMHGSFFTWPRLR